MKPIVKYVGGKTQLLDDINKKIKLRKNYIEPMVGGGAVFFHVLENYDFENYYINDISSNLINLYTNVKSNLSEVMFELLHLSSEYNSNDKESYYYERRKEFNKHNLDARGAALYIFLNKTCFNGLYRENLKGEFNVPWGKYESFKYDVENLKIANKLMNEKNVFITSGDYLKMNIPNDSFIYFDPPYEPIEKTSFTAYNSTGFTEKNQKELMEYCRTLVDNGNDILLSNSFKAEDIFSHKFDGFKVERVEARRNINSNGKKRGKVSEVLIYNT